MNRPTDEILVAYADGKLPDAQAEAVEAYLAGDPEMRRFVAALKSSEELIREAFDAPMREPGSRSVADMILAAPPHPAQQDNVIALPTGLRRAAPHRSDRSRWMPISIAASVALLVGLSAGSVLNRADTMTGTDMALGPIASTSLLHGVLEGQASGDVMALQADRGGSRHKLAIVATFRDRLERPCREFEIVTDTPDARPISAAVACRAANGRWVVEGAARLAADAAGAADSTFYPSGVREKDAIDGLLNLLGAGKSLSAADERELIARKWQK